MSVEEPTGRYGIVAYRPPREPPWPLPAWAAALAVFTLAVVLLTASWRTGYAVGREEAARRDLATWGAQVEAGTPTERVVYAGTPPPTPPGPWKQITLRYWLRRPDGAEPTDADVAYSLREWCATATAPAP